MTGQIRRLGLVAAALALVAMVAAGCGGSSSSSSTTGSSSALASSGGNRRAAIQNCLRKQGITPPARPRAGGGPFFGGGGFQGNPRVRDALRKCGITLRGRRAGGARFRQAINNFVACVRRNGYNLPAPNLSGNGPVFDPRKVNRNDPKFIAAARKCQSLLQFRRRFGAPGGAGAAA